MQVLRVEAVRRKQHPHAPDDTLATPRVVTPEWVTQIVILAQARGHGMNHCAPYNGAEPAYGHTQCNVSSGTTSKPSAKTRVAPASCSSRRSAPIARSTRSPNRACCGAGQPTICLDRQSVGGGKRVSVKLDIG